VSAGKHRGVQLTVLVHGMKVFDANSDVMHLIARYSGEESVDLLNSPGTYRAPGTPDFQVIATPVWLEDEIPDPPYDLVEEVG
jgi:hypothetical protein